MIKIRSTVLVPYRDGVVLYRGADLDRDVLARLSKAEDGRWEIVELYLAPGDAPLRTITLRHIPLGQIEAFANDSMVSAELEITSDNPVSLEEMARQIGAQQAELDLMNEAFEWSTIRKTRRRRPIITVPTKRPFPSSFYQRVSTLYTELAGQGARPAAAIADANDLPLSTVYAWIKECRQRELLPAGRAGKAG